jgi:DnaD/phage-associated family protein
MLFLLVCKGYNSPKFDIKGSQEEIRMSFVRTVKRENPFVQLDKYFLEDSNLSWGAKGILAYILSKPDYWVIRKEDLIKRSDDGKAKVEAALLNLMANGYINWFQEKNEDGTFGSWVYDVYERPEYNPYKEECIQQGLARINSKKDKVKERNNKIITPKVNNQLSGSPKVNNPISDNPTSDNQPYSNNDFSNIVFNNILEEEEEEEVTPVMDLINFYETNISNTGKEIIKNKLSEWLNIIPYEVIKAELETCALYGAKSWKYVQNALNESNKLGIKTVEQLNQKYENHNKKKSISKNSNGSSNQGKKGRTEVLPEWFNEEQPQQQPKPQVNDQELKARQAAIMAKIKSFSAK